MARVVIFDQMVFEPIAVVEINDSFLLAVARRQEPDSIHLGRYGGPPVTLRFEQVSTATGKFFWMLRGTGPGDTLTLRGAFIPHENYMGATLREALGALIR